ncbi:unnamed protein product [Caenorhabditis angaria]|uniref:Uncharacterized protein n=1 Tax=Caenorhabditis angaria TaxID=860376 RepID=A0A9P1IN08_9PELO|nr:unnamed protein product [Caenorhabditis angaria]
MRAYLITILFVLAMACIYVAAKEGEKKDDKPPADTKPPGSEPSSSGSEESGSSGNSTGKGEKSSAGMMGVASIISMAISYLLVNYF